MLCSWNHRLLYSKSTDWKIIGLEPCQNVSVRGSVENNNNNKQREIPKKIYLFPIFLSLIFFISTRNDVTPRLLFVIQTEREWGMQDRSSILFFILIIFFSTSSLSLPTSWCLDWVWDCYWHRHRAEAWKRKKCDWNYMGRWDEADRGSVLAREIIKTEQERGAETAPFFQLKCQISILGFEYNYLCVWTDF